MKKIFGFTLFIMQLMYIQADVISLEAAENEIIIHVDYASGWTGSGITNDINAKLDMLQLYARTENKSLVIKDIRISMDWGHAFIIYEISDKICEAPPIRTQVRYASAWTGPGITLDINVNLDLLRVMAEADDKFLNIKDIKIIPEGGYAFIIYEISDKISERVPFKTYVEYASAWSGPGITEDINNKLDMLRITAETENKILNIKDIKIVSEWGYAFIIYEVSEACDMQPK